MIKLSKPFMLIILLFLAAPTLLCAQTAAEIENLLQTKAITYEQAVRFVLEAADVQVFESPALAFSYAAEHNWLPKNSSPSAEVRLDGISLLIMRSFDIKGGLLYSLFKNPHYAYRELVYKNIIQGRVEPEMPVSGEMFLFIINRVLTLYDNDNRGETND